MYPKSEMAGMGFRCKGCNPLRLRVLRLDDEELLDNFWAMSEPARRSFFLKNRKAFKEDLRVATRDAVEEERIKETSVSFCGSGTFFDKEDLEAKYKNKPGRAALIMKNSKAITCKITNVQLWEDLVYTSSESETKKHVRKNTLRLNTDGVLKGATKKGKGNKKKGAKATADSPDPNVLSEVSLKKTQDVHGWYTEQILSFENHFTEIQKEGLGAYLPPNLLATSQSQVESLKVDAAELEISIQSKTGTLADIIKQWNLQKVATKQCLKSAALFIKEAKKMKPA